MRVVMDGIVYQMAWQGGIARMFTEILPRLCTLDPSLRIKLLLGAEPKGAMPTHPHITLQRVDRFSRHAPERLQQRLYGATRLIDSIWLPRAITHSTYYSVPRLRQGPLIVTLYDFAHEQLPQIFGGAKGDAFRREKRRQVLAADRVIAISHAVAAEAVQRYGLSPAKIQAIPLAYNPTFQVLPTAERDVPVKEPFILYVGGRNSYKNFETLARAFARWPRRGEVKLLTVGGGEPDRDEQALISELGIADDVIRLSRVDDSTLIQLYNAALAFVYPSLAEGFGIPLLEALACGCPVVASRIPTSLEVADDQAQYFDLIDPDPVGALVDALDQALGVGRSSAAVAARVSRTTAYSWDNTAAATLAVYKSVW